MLRQPLKALVLALSSVALTACINTTKPVTDADIQAAQAKQNLGQLYQQLRSQLKEDPDDPVLLSSLQKVGTQLAIETLADFENTLTAQLNAEQILPSANEPALTPLLDQLERYDTRYHQQAQALLDSAVAQRTDYIDQQLQLISELPASEPEQRFALSAAIAELDADENNQATRDQQLLWESLIQADHWLNQDDYPPAISLLEQLMQVQPSEDLKGKLHETRFKSAMATLKELQYKRDYTGQRKQLLALAAEYSTPEYLIQLEAPAQNLWQYHQKQAGDALDQGNLLQSHSHLSAARQLDGLYIPISDSDEQAAPVTERFSQRLLQAASASIKTAPAHTYALLSVLKTLGPLSDKASALATANQQTLQALFRQKVALLPFTAPEDAPNLNELMQQQLHNAATRYPQIQLMPQADSHPLRLQGIIEEATITTQQQTETFEKEVVTDRLTLPNPAFTRWQQLTQSERQNIPQPMETLEEEVISSIPHHVTTEVKSAQLSTSFRVLSGDNTSPIYADTLTNQTSAAAVSEAEVQAGLYFQPAKAELLPDDQTLYQTLIKQQAELILATLVESLTPPAGRTLADARILQATGESDAAIQVLTEAFVLGYIDPPSQIRARSLLNSLVLQQHSSPVKEASTQ